MLLVVVVVVGLLLLGGGAVLRLAMGSGAGVLVAAVVAGAVVLVVALALVTLVGVDAGHDDASAADSPALAPDREADADAAPEPDVRPGGDAERAVAHDPVRLWAGLGVAALLLLVAGVLLRGTDWSPIGPDPWGDDDPPGEGRVGSGPTAAPR